HVERCEDCAHLRISYNSCRDRHCPKCQAAAAKEWLADRQAELLPVPYFHVVFSLPGPIADIAYQNKAVVYDLLLKTAAETLITIAADSKHLAARIRLAAFDGECVISTWTDYRAESATRYKPMTRDSDDCTPRFLIPVPRAGFHRVRHYALLTNGTRTGNIALARRLVGGPARPPSSG